MHEEGPPASLRLACLVLAGEAVALLAVAGYAALAPLTHRVANVGITEGEAASALLGALVLGLLARALWRCRRWARTPAALLQVLALPIAVDQIRGAAPLLGAILAAFALGVLGPLLAPSARRALEEPARASG